MIYHSKFVCEVYFMGFVFFSGFYDFVIYRSISDIYFFKGILVFIRGAKMKIQGGNQKAAGMMLML